MPSGANARPLDLLVHGNRWNPPRSTTTQPASCVMPRDTARPSPTSHPPTAPPVNESVISDGDSPPLENPAAYPFFTAAGRSSTRETSALAG